MKPKLNLFTLTLFFSLFWGITPILGGKVAVLVSAENSIYEETLFGIQSSLDNELTISYLEEIQDDYESSGAYLQTLEASQYSLVIAIGSQAARYLGLEETRLPLVFTATSYPKALILSNRNSCGIGMDVPFDQIFSTAKELSPQIQRIKAFYSTKENEILAKEGEYFDLKHQIVFEPKKITIASFEEELKLLEGNTDAFLLLGDPLFDSERFQVVSEYCKKHKIVLITFFPALVRKGASFSINVDYTRMGVDTASFVKKILKQETNCKETKLIHPQVFSFYTNENYLKESGFILPNSLQERAKTTKLMEAGIQLFNDEKWKQARGIFEAILRQDPKNQSSLQYLNIIIDKMEGKKTKEMSALAERYLKEEKYSNAIAEFKKILFLNPNDGIAKEGIATATRMQSEKDRSRAKALVQSGQLKQGLQAYLSSLKMNPENQASKMELASIRKQEEPSIVQRTKQGTDLYHLREYDKAIDLFETILLIDPNQKSAQEYLRLSLKKKSALQALENKK